MESQERPATCMCMCPDMFEPGRVHKTSALVVSLAAAIAKRGGSSLSLAARATGPPVGPGFALALHGLGLATARHRGIRERVLRTVASAAAIGSSFEADVNTASRGSTAGMGSSGGGPQRSGLLSLGAAVAASERGSLLGRSSAASWLRFDTRTTPTPDKDAEGPMPLDMGLFEE